MGHTAMTWRSSSRACACACTLRWPCAVWLMQSCLQSCQLRRLWRKPFLQQTALATALPANERKQAMALSHREQMSHQLHMHLTQAGAACFTTRYAWCDVSRCANLLCFALNALANRLLHAVVTRV
jgi:hypothetical protein